ncbi:MAG: hypothetical protein WAO75_00175, partial [Atribacterales bacterium]
DRKRGRHPGDFRAVFSLPLNASIRNLNYLRAKTWIPTSSSPRQSLSRGLQYLKTWIPDKKFRE